MEQLLINSLVSILTVINISTDSCITAGAANKIVDKNKIFIILAKEEKSTCSILSK